MWGGGMRVTRVGTWKWQREKGSGRQESEPLSHSLLSLVASNICPHQDLITIVLACPNVAIHFLH